MTAPRILPRLLVPFLLLAVFLAAGAPVRADDLDLTLIVPTFATPPITRDSDGDGLPDLWEMRGYTVNGVFVDLPALGASPWHKDLFVWMDYMVTPEAAGSVNLGPSQAVIDNIKAVFNNAPATNPDGTTGIHIHPMLKNEVDYKESLGVSGDYVQVWTDFDTLKTITPAYAQSFRYMIWANTYNQGTSSGLARNIPATDFLVALGGWSPVGGSDWEKLGTFIHELGHCLGLRHGGSDNDNYKPNYLSVMNYFFQTWGLYKDGHWGNAGYVLNFDYQRINTPSLNKGALNEFAGLTGADDVSNYGTRYWYYDNGWFNASVTNAAGSIDWNHNGTIESNIAADINKSGYTYETLTAQNNWQNINYNASGEIGPSAGVARARASLRETPSELREELNFETQQMLKQSHKEPSPAAP